ncbi:hypothetical protein ABTM78_21370, partial [Acinetobacter baumannii]
SNRVGRANILIAAIAASGGQMRNLRSVRCRIRYVAPPSNVGLWAESRRFDEATRRRHNPVFKSGFF